MRGVRWTVLSYVVTKVLSVVTTLVLARLLLPADFGIFALALVITGSLEVFRELGLGAAFVIRQDLDARGQATVLALMIAAGAAVAAVVAVSAPLLACAFGEPLLAELLWALSAVTALSGVSAFYASGLQRELRFRRRFVADLAQSVVAASVGVGAAVLGAGVWSFVAGFAAGLAVFTVVLVIVSPNRTRPAYEAGEARRLLREGRGFVAQGGTAFLQQNTDYLAVGLFLSPTHVGWYSMSYRLAELPYLAIADPVATVTFPAFARMWARGEDIGPLFLGVLQLVAFVTVPIGLILSAAAEPFTRAILGQPWLPMVGVLSILGLLAGIRSVHVTLAWLLNSVGQAGTMARVSAVTLGALIPALLAAAALGGLTAVAWVVLADVALAALALALVIHVRLSMSLALQWATLRPVVMAAIVAWPAGRLVAGGPPDALVALVASAAAVLAAYVLVVAIIDASVITNAVRQARRARGPALAPMASSE